MFYVINPDIRLTYCETNVTNSEILRRRSSTLMESHVLSRISEFCGQKLPDPNPQLSPEEVRNLYAHQYPDIATASITGPEAVGDKLRYQFTRAIGSKG